MAAGAMLERDRELAALARAVDSAGRGDGGVALIEGPAGIGKSRLLAEARRMAADAGTRVLGARGGELERDFAFGVVRQLFEPSLTDPDARERLLAGAAAPARAVFDPVAGDPAGDGGDASFAALHGLYWLSVNLSSEAPLLIAIDDLHWTDRPSLRFLVYLARRLEGLPALVACSVRPAEPGADAALIGELAHELQAEIVRPAELSEVAVAGLVGEHFGEGTAPAFARACHEATGGNPLLLGELIKALAEEGVAGGPQDLERVHEVGPRAASRAVLLRLGRLPPEAAQAARALSVLGEGADLGTVAALAELDEPAAAAGTAALARAEIIGREAPLAFIHPLVRAAVYRDLAAGERELLHDRAATILAAAGARAERVAAQLLAVPPRGDAGRVETLTSAARESLRKGAADSAVTYLARALEEPPPETDRGPLLLELGTAETRVHGPAATDHLRQAVSALEDPAVRLGAMASLARTLLFTGSLEEARELAGAAAAQLPPDAVEARQKLEALELIAVMFGGGVGAERLAAYRGRPPGDGVGPGMLQGLASWQAAHALEPAAECVRIAREALEDGRLVADEGSLMAFPPTIVLMLADDPGALAGWDAIRTRMNSRGSLVSAGWVQVWRGHTLYAHGEVDEALAELRGGREALALWGESEIAATYSAAPLVHVLIERGELDAAAAVLDAAPCPGGVPERALLWLRARARLLLARGEDQAALAALDDLAARAGGREGPSFFDWRPLRAAALARTGRGEEAAATAAEAVEVARRWGAPRALSEALRVHAEHGGLAPAEAIELHEEAAAAVDGSPARLEHARALAALGVALSEAGRGGEARDPLRRGLELAEICGAPPLAEHTRQALYATGARPRAAAMSGPDALTPSERRVADLAAAGGSNRDIAQALFVTPKTVEVHLSNSYRKLGIGSRRELAGALG